MKCITATALCVYFVLSSLSLSSLFHEVSGQRTCPPGKFRRIGANCTNNIDICVTECFDAECAFNGDCMQQGNHTTGNCERGR